MSSPSPSPNENKNEQENGRRASRKSTPATATATPVSPPAMSIEPEEKPTPAVEESGTGSARAPDVTTSTNGVTNGHRSRSPPLGTAKSVTCNGADWPPPEEQVEAIRAAVAMLGTAHGQAPNGEESAEKTPNGAPPVAVITMADYAASPRRTRSRTESSNQSREQSSGPATGRSSRSGSRGNGSTVRKPRSAGLTMQNTDAAVSSRSSSPPIRGRRMKSGSTSTRESSARLASQKGSRDPTPVSASSVRRNGSTSQQTPDITIKTEQSVSRSSSPPSRPGRKRGSTSRPSTSDGPIKSQHDSRRTSFTSQRKLKAGLQRALEDKDGKKSKASSSRASRDLSLPPLSKVVKMSPAEILALPDSYKEATSKFKVIQDLHYSRKALGSAGQEEIMTCECKEEWDDGMNQACGEDSDCINRICRVECTDDCGCGPECKNQRFQNKEYADITVVDMKEKGFGLRTNEKLSADAFICEYVGEVIDDPAMHERLDRYDREKEKHFYFMALSNKVFIDATRKGGIARFCNHSCNPNCYVDKWVVGDKLRMGIFAKKSIRAGEELVFDYNVDRYGAKAQRCYCGEPNCLGILGGKTQTGGPKLDFQLTLALDSAASLTQGKKGKKKRRSTADLDQDYEPESGISPEQKANAVAKVMAALVRAEDLSIILPLVKKLLDSNDPWVYSRVRQLHGYETFARILEKHGPDDGASTMILQLLLRFPRLTKNRITSSKIEGVVKNLCATGSDEVKQESETLLADWASLQTAFRIPRAPNAAAVPNYHGGVNAYSDRIPVKVAERSPSPPSRPRTPTKPRGFEGRPRGGYLGKNFNPDFRAPRGPRNPHQHRLEAPLPTGWRVLYAPNGMPYYISNGRRSQWEFPTEHCWLPDDGVPLLPPPRYEPGKNPMLNKGPTPNEELTALVEKVQREKAAEKARMEEEARKKREEERKEEERKRREVKKAKRQRVFDKDTTISLLKKAFASVLPNLVRKAVGDLVDKEECKKFAKQLVNTLVEKEMKNASVKGRMPHDPAHCLDNAEKKKKVIDWAEDYLAKLKAKILSKSTNKKDGKRKRDDHDDEDSPDSAKKARVDEKEGSVEEPELEGKRLELEIEALVKSGSASAVAKSESMFVDTPTSSGETPVSPKRKRELEMGEKDRDRGEMKRFKMHSDREMLCNGML